MHFVTPIIDLAPSWPSSFTVRITISLKLNTFNQGALTNHSPKSILAGSYICLLILPATTIIFQTLICFHIFTQAHSWLSSFLKTCTNCLQDSPFVQFSFILSVVNNKSGQYSDITSRSMSNLCILLLLEAYNHELQHAVLDQASTSQIHASHQNFAVATLQPKGK